MKLKHRQITSWESEKAVKRDRHHITTSKEIRAAWSITQDHLLSYIVRNAGRDYTRDTKKIKKDSLTVITRFTRNEK